MGNKYYIIAGEASGEMHGANLLKELKRLDPDASFRGWGGDRMQSEGMTLVKHYRETSFMGFLEVIKNIRTIINLFSITKKDITLFNPDVAILIDYPGFNLRMAKWLHQRNIKVVYYISPQVWAWKESRVYSIKRYVQLMVTILPFEQDFYARYKYPVAYVGHPLLDEIAKYPIKDKTERKDIMAILPGSRKQEIEMMLLPMMKAAMRHQQYSIIIAAPASIDKNFYISLLSRANISSADYSITQNQTYDLLQKAKLALVTSGTATLETALWEVPQVVCYKGNHISYWIAKRLVKLPYISLVNLIAEQSVVKELIQQDFTENKIKEAIKWTLDNHDDIISQYKDIKIRLGGKGASAKAAKLIMNLI